MAYVSRDRTNPASEWLPEGAKLPPADGTVKQRTRASAFTDPTASAPSASLEDVDSGVREWLLDEPTSPPPQKPTRPPRQVERDGPDPTEEALAESRSRIAQLEESLDQRQVEFEEALEQREAEFEETLKEREAEYAYALRERDEALKEREAELKERFDERYEQRQAELLEQATRREEELEGRIEELESALLEARQEATSKSNAALTPEASQEENPKRSRRRASTSKNGGLDINGATFEQLRELGLSVTQSARMIAYRDTCGGFDSLDELDEIPGLPRETRATLRSQLRL